MGDMKSFVPRRSKGEDKCQDLIKFLDEKVRARFGRVELKDDAGGSLLHWRDVLVRVGLLFLPCSGGIFLAAIGFLVLFNVVYLSWSYC